MGLETMLTSYALYKLVHLTAVLLFLGNVSLGLFWVAHAQRSGDARLIAHAMDGVIRADRWFTWPGVAFLVIGGLAAAISGKLPLLRTGWIATSIALLSISGLVFAVSLAPLQRKIVLYASASTPDPAQLTALLHRWHAVGWLSLAPLWLAVAAMVLKLPS